MLLLWNPFPPRRQGTVKDSHVTQATNMRRAESPNATKNRRLASQFSARDGAGVSSDVRGSTRDVKRCRTEHYRIFAAANERSDQTVHNNRGVGKKNFRPHSGGDSPRRSLPAPVRLASVLELARGSDKIVSGGSSFPVRSHDNGDWPSVGSIAGPPRDSRTRNNGSADD